MVFLLICDIVSDLVQILMAKTAAEIAFRPALESAEERRIILHPAAASALDFPNICVWQDIGQSSRNMDMVGHSVDSDYAVAEFVGNPNDIGIQFARILRSQQFLAVLCPKHKMVV